MPTYDVQGHFLQYFSYKVAKLDKKQALENFFNRKCVFIWIQHMYLNKCSVIFKSWHTFCMVLYNWNSVECGLKHH